MGQAVYPAGAIDAPGETLALTSTLASLGIPPNVHQMILYNPAVDFRLHLNPAIIAVAYYDASNAAGARWEHGSGSGQSLLVDLIDRDTGTGTGTAMDSGATGDRLYVCLSAPAGGLRVVMGSVSDQVSTLTVKYPTVVDTAWTSISATDGTQTGGNTTFGQTGSLTWTMPTDWRGFRLDKQDFVATPTNINQVDAPGVYGFWLELSWSAALGSNTEIDELWSLNKDTSRGYFRAGQEYTFSLDRRKMGAFEAVLAAGSDTLEVTWIKVAGV